MSLFIILAIQEYQYYVLLCYSERIILEDEEFELLLMTVLIFFSKYFLISFSNKRTDNKHSEEKYIKTFQYLYDS